jgi:hypothetical protein
LSTVVSHTSPLRALISQRVAGAISGLVGSVSTSASRTTAVACTGSFMVA